MDANQDRMISIEEFLKVFFNLFTNKDNNLCIMQDNEAQAPGKPKEEWDDLNKQKIYTSEELKKFEQEYASQKGWGEEAYETTAHHNINAQNQQQPPQNLYVSLLSEEMRPPSS
jgi:hypothetical protein